MSSLPRSTGSFKRLRAVRSLVWQLFRRRRRKFVKKFAIPSITISSSPTPISANFTTMSLILHCRHLQARARSNTGDDDSALTSPLSSIEDMFSEDVLHPADDDDEGPCDEDDLKLQAVSQRSVSHDSIFPKDFGRKMIRTSRGFNASISDEHSSNSIPSGNVSSLKDISNALRTELENKMFVRAKRLNSATNDLPFSSRVRPDSTSSPFRTTSNFESSFNSMASFSTSTSEVERNNFPTSSRYSAVSYNDDQRGEEGFQAMMPSAQTSLLSHEAAKHRIAIKPKNRRPKSFHPTLETSPKSSPTRCDFSVAPFSLAHSQDVGPSRHSVTVVSEVEASYEVLPAEALALGRQTSPQSTVHQHTARKATTLAYSKSFHVARRTSSESSAPLTVSVSPRLTRHQPLVIKSIPPQVPPKTFSTDNDEFKKVFSKFRKHTDADSFDTVISSANFDEPRSLVPHATFPSGSFSFSVSSLPLTKSNSIVAPKSVHRAVERKFSSAAEDDERSSKKVASLFADVSKQPAIPTHFQSHIPSFSSKQANPLLPFKKMDYFPIKQESPTSPLSSPSPFHSSDILTSRSDSFSSTSRSPPAVLDKPAIDYHKLPAILLKEETMIAPFTETPKDGSRNLSELLTSLSSEFSPAPVVPVRKRSLESGSIAKPLVSPKPVMRVKSGQLNEPSQSKAEQELMKILAKRSAHLQELDADQNPSHNTNFDCSLSAHSSSVVKPLSPEWHSPIPFDKTTEVRELSSMEPTLVKIEHVRSSLDLLMQRPLVPILKHLRTYNGDTTDNNVYQVNDTARLDLLLSDEKLRQINLNDVPQRKSSLKKVETEEATTDGNYSTSAQTFHFKKKLFMPVEANLTKTQPKKIDVHQSLQPFKSIFTDSSSNKEAPSVNNDNVLADLSVNPAIGRRASEPQPVKRFQPVEYPILRPDQPLTNDNPSKKNLAWRKSMFESSSVKSDPFTDQENLPHQEPFFPIILTTSTQANMEDVIPYPKVSSRAAIFQQKSLPDFKPLSPRNGDNDRVKSAPVNRGSIRRPAASAYELSHSPNRALESDKTVYTPLKNLSQSQYPLTDSTWTASVPALPLKPPVLPSKPAKSTALSSQVSCGTLSSTVPSWVALAHEKRKRIEMLTESTAAAY